MIPNVAYVQEKFGEFNRMIFDGKLPEPPISITNAKTYLGVCAFRKHRKWHGKLECSDFKIRISRRFDLPQEEIDDTIIHEMIHYWIGLFSPADMPGHSPLFRKMMTDINARYDRHIRVSHRLSAEQQEQAIDKRPKKHVVASVVLKDGRTGIKVIPCMERHIRRYRRGMMASGKVRSIQFYQTTDPFFNRYPSSSAFTVYFLDPAVIASHLNAGDDLKEYRPGGNT
ncbi:MAG: SprT-like domain-containing protein [Bacteroidaceae bacterium]|nr:SprT-like domain-containing protein [Bacteroidaceae bacterium]